MLKTNKVGIVLSLILISSLGFAQVHLFNDKVDRLFQLYVTDGAVDYSKIKQNEELTQEIKSAFFKVDLDETSNQLQMAFYINAYNFWVIDKTTRHYPINSVMDVSDFFQAPHIPWNGRMYTLNEFEQEIFTKFPEEPRLHFVLVCAAKGCPDLSNRAFTEGNLNTKLKKKTRVAIRDEKMVKLDMHEKKAYVSKIFDWYKTDFTKNQSLREFINYYRNNDIPVGFEINFQEYDWSLNEKSGSKH